MSEARVTTLTKVPGRLSETEATQPGVLGKSFQYVDNLAKQVECNGACTLPGCSFCFDVFIPIMQRAAQRGFVLPERAAFVYEGLRYGFRCGVDVTKMRGRRRFSNYPSAFEASAKVSDAIRKRVDSSKTLCLGKFGEGDKLWIPFPVWCIFPMGAVKKKVEDAMRPVDDHTRTLLNASAELEGLRFTLRTHQEVAECFHKMFYMSVKDVSDAFPLLPLHPSLWPFTMFCWYFVGTDNDGLVARMWCLTYTCSPALAWQVCLVSGRSFSRM